MRDLDGVASHCDRFAKDFKVVVNFRPEKDVKTIPLRCKNTDLALLFGTRDEMVNNREMMGTPSPVNNVTTPNFEDQPKGTPVARLTVTTGSAVKAVVNAQGRSTQAGADWEQRNIKFKL